MRNLPQEKLLGLRWQLWQRNLQTPPRAKLDHSNVTKTLDLSSCQNVRHVGLTSLTSGIELSGFKKVLTWLKKIVEVVKFRKCVSREELKAFDKFENTAEALSTATLLLESKANKGLRKFLRAHCQGETLGAVDSKLGITIKEKLQIECVHNNAIMELMREVRRQLTECSLDEPLRIWS